MFHFIRSAFSRLRVVFGALRSGLWGFALVCAGWIYLAPPSQTEAARLSLPPGASADHEVLRAHRMAKLLMIVGSDRIYRIVASQSDLPADTIRQSIETAADGSAFVPLPTPTGADAIQKASTQASGAKFVTARTTP